MKEPKVTNERRGEIIQNILQILDENPDGIHRNEVLKSLEKRVGLTEHESGFYDNDPEQRRFEKMAQFHTIGPTKAGWIKKGKGVWSISDDGRKALQDFQTPEELVGFTVNGMKTTKRAR
jgi:restriction system protein